MADRTTELRWMRRADIGNAIVAGYAPLYRSILVARNFYPGVIWQSGSDMNLLDNRVYLGCWEFR